MRITLGVLLVLMSGTVQAKPERKPKGPPPEIVDADAALKGDLIELYVHKVMFVPETRTREVLKDGVKVLENYTVNVPVVVVTTRLLAADTRVMKRDGKPIDVKTLPKLLAKPAPV